MRYKVITRFKDLKDDGYVYEIGDEYPRNGKKVSKKRIAELLSEENAIGEPIIEEVE